MKKKERFKGQEIACPFCGRKIAWDHKRSFVYGSPFRVCEGCGKKYYDERFREICVDDFYVGDRLILPVWKVIATVAAFAVLGFSLSGWCSWIFGLTAMEVMFAVGFLSFFLLLSMDIYEIAGYARKKKRLKKLELESIARIQDPDYRRVLEEKGKYVLKKYISYVNEEIKRESEAQKTR